MTIDGNVLIMVLLMLVAMILAIFLLMHGTNGKNY